jgi:hypothetical protein
MQTNNVAPDQRLQRLVQEVDRERKGRIKAERQSRALRLALARALAKISDAKAKPAAANVR